MRLRLLPLFLFLCPTFWTVASEQSTVRAIRVNPAALEFAQQLIKDGSVVLDQKGNWRRDQPSATLNNEFIRIHGLDAYGRWHLGVDSRHRSGSKAHYKFPFGDFKALHRCGLLAVKARAHEFGYAEIENAAAQLLQMLESTSPGRQKRVD